MRLAEDIAWCNTIVWSKDSSRVGFLVQDAWLVVADGATGEVVWDGWLVEQDGYPTHDSIFNLALSADGSEATFERCPPRDPGSCDVRDSVDLRLPS